MLEERLPLTAETPARVSLRPSAGEELQFEVLPERVSAEVVNNAVNIAVPSKSGMLFELTGIPLLEGRDHVLRPVQYRALLLNHPISRKAATDDGDAEAKLELKNFPGSRKFWVNYMGKLAVDGKVLDAEISFLVEIPMSGHDVETTPAIMEVEGG